VSKDLTASSTWNTSNPAVATISNGLVTGIATGWVTITATVNGISGTAKTAVGPLPNIEILPADSVFSLAAKNRCSFQQ
jgi:hypothetical protein